MSNNSEFELPEAVEEMKNISRQMVNGFLVDAMEDMERSAGPGFLSEQQALLAAMVVARSQQFHTLYLAQVLQESSTGIVEELKSLSKTQDTVDQEV